MFDISWGEIAVLGAVGVAVTGKRDLPRACHFVGHQLGRVVGLLQGARARADRFAHHNELKALQNELRSGLRELDQVKTELAVAASTRGVMGRTLGATTASANRNRTSPGLAGNHNNHNSIPPTPQSLSSSSTSLQRQQGVPSPLSFPPPAPSANFPTSHSSILHNTSKTKKKDSSENISDPNNSSKKGPMQLSLSDFDFQVAEDSVDETSDPSNISSNAVDSSISSLPDSSEDHHHDPSMMPNYPPELSPVAQSERAVMEEEWAKQGIGFQAQAEQGSWRSGHEEEDGEGVVDTTRATGSELLEHLERQCLIFDQYDRVVGEQEAKMEERVERIRHQRKEGRDPQGNKGDDNKP